MIEEMVSDTGRDNTESNYMDIERFAPNAGSTPPAAIQTLPATVELTGFSGQRHYLEQQTTFDPSSRHQSNDTYWVPPLDSQH
ncbi:hypothetical protein [Photobacterium chitinilyticum]|nr:hypothetical protein [Photobacterium chitinilyticum]